MKLFASLLLLATSVFAQSPKPSAIAGTWEGTATVHGQQVPVKVQITGGSGNFQAALLNGPETSPASNVTLDGDHLLVTFNYYARTLDATLKDGKLSGTFGTISTRYPLALALNPAASTIGQSWSTEKASTDILGEWEIATKARKGEAAWQMRIDAPNSHLMKAVIQRIDGDTGALYATAPGDSLLFSHFTAAGPALYKITPGPDGTMLRLKSAPRRC